jgi:hypothetical protein
MPPRDSTWLDPASCRYIPSSASLLPSSHIWQVVELLFAFTTPSSLMRQLLVYGHAGIALLILLYAWRKHEVIHPYHYASQVS